MPRVFLKHYVFPAVFFIFASTLSITVKAQTGGLYAEPGVTYEYLDNSISWPAPFSSSTGTTRGLGLSARLGIHASEIIFVALDGRYSRPQFKDSSTNVESSATSYNWGPVVGVQMPVVGLRVWGQYVMDGTLNPEASGNFDYLFNQATGYRIGAGFRVTLVSINLEYQDLKYKTTVENAYGFNTNASFSSAGLTSKGWVLGVSFPLEM